MTVTEILQRELEEIIEAAHRASADVGAEVEALLRDGRENPLTREETVALLGRVVTVLKEGVTRRGDERGASTLAGDVSDLVERVVRARDRAAAPRAKGPGVALVEHNGIAPAHVVPTPIFHTRPVPMVSGFVKLSDLQLWDGNERLDIHLAQFQQARGRKPTQTELVQIMTNVLKMPGSPAGDEFDIPALARSIATNGVQKPPILSYDGTLLDGNRRVTACHYILGSDEFDAEEKRRAEYIFVWRLTEHATAEDREAVVVALNFESACKKEWPDYIKARKVYDEWHSMLAREVRTPGPQRQAEMKRELSKKFALGPDTNTVNRYLKMIDWANEFEEYLINDRGRDAFEVQHASNTYFQYFDELAKGAKPGGVAHTLNQDEAYKHLVFDLLHQGKFKNFAAIRKLKYLDEDTRQGLLRGRDEADLETAQDKVEEALDAAHARNAEVREVGANVRIESFVKFLEQLPVSAFRDRIKPENLRALLRALELVQGHVKGVLGE